MKHVIFWTLKKEYSEEEKKEIKANAKNALENLTGQIPGLKAVSVLTEMLPTSTADMMLYTEFTDNEAYLNYKTHPLHVAAADKYVRPFIDLRLCCDYDET